mmetsp:Transcript_23726/g.59945  ORF Transcript_23726/g.59945 Transcript_23726/m.59945 type:complete len:304 (-) Transcript_23726:1025-1936(-)
MRHGHGVIVLRPHEVLVVPPGHAGDHRHLPLRRDFAHRSTSSTFREPSSQNLHGANLLCGDLPPDLSFQLLFRLVHVVLVGSARSLPEARAVEPVDTGVVPQLLHPLLRRRRHVGPEGRLRWFSTRGCSLFFPGSGTSSRVSSASERRRRKEAANRTIFSRSTATGTLYSTRGTIVLSPPIPRLHQAAANSGQTQQKNEFVVHLHRFAAFLFEVLPLRAFVDDAVLVGGLHAEKIAHKTGVLRVVLVDIVPRVVEQSPLLPVPPLGRVLGMELEAAEVLVAVPKPPEREHGDYCEEHAHEERY